MQAQAADEVNGREVVGILLHQELPNGLWRWGFVVAAAVSLLDEGLAKAIEQGGNFLRIALASAGGVSIAQAHQARQCVCGKR